MKRILLAICVGLLSLAVVGCSTSNEEKYQSCINACEKNNTCLESIEIGSGIAIPDANYGSPKPRSECSKWSIGECKNICVQKYK